MALSSMLGLTGDDAAQVADKGDDFSPLALPTSLEETPMAPSPAIAPVPGSPNVADDVQVTETCTIIINGLQKVTIELPQKQTGSTVQGKLSISERCMRALSGTPPRVHIVVSAQNALLEREASVKCSLRFSSQGGCEHSCELGELTSRMDSLCHIETLPFVPIQAELSLTYNASAVARDSEQTLVETLRDIIADDKINPRGGSIPASLAEEILTQKAADLYREVAVQKYGSLEAFLKQHEDVFTHFTFSDRALKKKTVSPEPRIVLKPGQREMCTSLPMTPAEKRLHDYLIQILGREDIDKRDLLDLLSNDTGFATFLSPTLSILMRFLSRHKDVFVWSMDPDKPTVVGLQGRQHDSASLGQQASLDKAMAAPTGKKWGGGGQRSGQAAEGSAAGAEANAGTPGASDGPPRESGREAPRDAGRDGGGAREASGGGGGGGGTLSTNDHGGGMGRDQGGRDKGRMRGARGGGGGGGGFREHQGHWSDSGMPRGRRDMGGGMGRGMGRQRDMGGWGGGRMGHGSRHQPGQQVIEIHQQVPQGSLAGHGGQVVHQQPQTFSQLPPHLQQLVGNMGPNQQVIIETIYTDQLPPEVAASVGSGGGVVVYEETLDGGGMQQDQGFVLQEVRQMPGQVFSQQGGQIFQGFGAPGQQVILEQDWQGS